MSLAFVPGEPMVLREVATSPSLAVADGFWVKVGARLEGLLVLVVDDDPDSLDMMSTLLRLQGADVVAASAAEEALVRYAYRRPHVLVADLSMSGRDGLWLIREVRTLAGPRVPAIAVTGVSGRMSMRQALAEGYDVYFTKPVDPVELWAAVASCARASGGARPA